MRALYRIEEPGQCGFAVFWTVTDGVRVGKFPPSDVPKLKDLTLIVVDDGDELLDYIAQHQKDLKAEGYKLVDFPRDMAMTMSDDAEGDVGAALTIVLPIVEEPVLHKAAVVMQEVVAAFAESDIKVTLPSQGRLDIHLEDAAGDKPARIYEVACSLDHRWAGGSKLRVTGGTASTVMTSGKIEDLLFRVLAAVIHREQGGVKVIDGERELANPGVISLQSRRRKSGAWWDHRENLRDVLEEHELLTLGDRMKGFFIQPSETGSSLDLAF
ncbi:MAG: hypothetical protein RJQ08_10745 [Salinisphaeraceae bacterium]